MRRMRGAGSSPRGGRGPGTAALGPATVKRSLPVTIQLPCGNSGLQTLWVYFIPNCPKRETARPSLAARCVPELWLTWAKAGPLAPLSSGPSSQRFQPVWCGATYPAAPGREPSPPPAPFGYAASLPRRQAPSRSDSCMRLRAVLACSRSVGRPAPVAEFLTEPHLGVECPEGWQTWWFPIAAEGG